MSVTLQGSCRCKAVTFAVASHTPVPYQLCYCSICRKQAGGGGFAVNLGADAGTLQVEGEEHLGLYRAEIHDKERGTRQLSSAERRFCRQCGSALWVYDPTWPDLVHPFASAIDSDLPVPPSRVHLMLRYKAGWVEPEVKLGDEAYDLYPELSLADWHKKHGVWVD